MLLTCLLMPTLYSFSETLPAQDYNVGKSGMSQGRAKKLNNLLSIQNKMEVK